MLPVTRFIQLKLRYGGILCLDLISTSDSSTDEAGITGNPQCSIPLMMDPGCPRIKEHVICVNFPCDIEQTFCIQML